jgi:hypothetical protein
MKINIILVFISITDLFKNTINDKLLRLPITITF